MEEDDGTTQTIYYFVNDHLSSASVVTDTSGTLLSENRYTPFGEVRDLPASMSTDDPITETDFGYTSQRDLGSIGLMDYNARFYSPTLGRFVQPDSIVLGLGNPQGLDRYSYASNNPMNFIDPSGHMPAGCLDFSGCGPVERDPRSVGGGQLEDITDDITRYGWGVDEDWSQRELQIALEGIRIFGGMLADNQPINSCPIKLRLMHLCTYSPQQLSTLIFSGQTLQWDPNNEGRLDNGNEFYCQRVTTTPGFECYDNARNRDDFTIQTIIHEIEHVFNAIIANNIDDAGLTGEYTTPYNSTNALDIDWEHWRDFLDFRENPSHTAGEQFADAHANWVLGKIKTTDSNGNEIIDGTTLVNFFNEQTGNWINWALGNFP